MKIKLFFPPIDRIWPIDITLKYQLIKQPPLSLATLTAFMRDKGYHTDQEDLLVRYNYSDLNKGDNKINLNYFKVNKELIFKKLAKNRITNYMNYLCRKLLNSNQYKNYDMIGFSLMDINQLVPALTLSQSIKENSGNTIVFGGPVVDLVGENILKKFDFIDFLAYGDGEYALRDIANFLEGKISKESMSNVIFKKDNKIIRNKASNFDVNKGLLPDFKGLHLDLYRQDGKLTLPYKFINGCPNRCSFCTHIYKYDKIYAKNRDSVVSDLEEISNEYKTNYFYFCNNLLNINYDYTKKLCLSIVKKKIDIKFASSAKPKFINKELALKLKKAGCAHLRFGVESGSQRMINLMNKNNSILEIESALKNVSEQNINSVGYFIVGFLNETKEDYNKTKIFIAKNKKFIDLPIGMPFTLTKGSEISMLPEKYGIENLRLENDLSPRFKYDVVNGNNWEQEFSKIKDRYFDFQMFIEKLDYLPYKSIFD